LAFAAAAAIALAGAAIFVFGIGPIEQVVADERQPEFALKQ
jgi:hypothetical protein